MLVHGGANGPILHPDTYVLLCEPYCRALSWQCLDIEGAPSGRWAHTASEWNGFAILHAGHARRAMCDTYALDCREAQPDRWGWLEQQTQMKVRGQLPPSRYGHAAAVVGDVLWVHGGIIESEEGGDASLLGSATLLGSAVLHTCALSLQEPAPAAVVTGSDRGGSRRPSRISSAASERGLVGAGVTLHMQWDGVSAQGKPPRHMFGHSFSYAAGALWAFGGRMQWWENGFAHVTVTNELHVLRGLPQQHRPPRAATASRASSSSALLRAPSAAPAPMGDAAGGVCDSLRWEVVAPLGPLPPPRAFHTAVTLGNQLLIYGGELHNGSGQPSEQLSYLSDIFVFELPHLDDTSTPQAEAALGSTALRASAGSSVTSGSSAPEAHDAHLLTEETIAGAASLYLDEEPAAGAADEQHNGEPQPQPNVANASAEASVKGSGQWREIVPHGTRTAPPSSLAAFCAVDASLVIFGGFNDQPDADLSQVHLVSLCPGLGQAADLPSAAER